MLFSDSSDGFSIGRNCKSVFKLCSVVGLYQCPIPSALLLIQHVPLVYAIHGACTHGL